jgi:hypothetical protein
MAHMAYDLAAISAWQLEQWDDALRYGEMALEMSPNDERFINNVKFYRRRRSRCQHSRRWWMKLEVTSLVTPCVKIVLRT